MTPCTHELGSGFLSSQPYAAECGTLYASENRNDSGARLIGLPVVRLPATGATTTEPLFWLRGGPGQTNLQPSHLETFLDHRDVVLVGYRGVDGSVLLSCPEVTAALAGAAGDLHSDETLSNFSDAYRRCGQRLLEEGVDLDGYTMVEVVEDLEDVRRGLGYGRIDLFSQSYGTRVAQIYAWLHPGSLRRSAMVSVNPPGHFVWEPHTIDRQIEHYAELCARDARCSARTDDLAETIRSVAHDMPSRWLFFRIKPGNVKVGSFMLFFHTGTARLAFDSWLAAAEGDASGLAAMSLMVEWILPESWVWGEAAAKAITADFDPTRDYRGAMSPPGSIIGSPVSLLQWSGAAGWPARPIPEDLRRVLTSRVETLLVSGNVDFSTPAQAATEELLPHLEKGEQVILSEFGHTNDVWGLQPEATERLLRSFYDTGVADDSLFSYQPMKFAVGLGLPEIVKAVVLAVVVVAVGLSFVVGLVARRWWRRPRGGRTR